MRGVVSRGASETHRFAARAPSVTRHFVFYKMRPHSRRKSTNPVKKTQRRLFLGIRGISGRELPTPPDCRICLEDIHRPVKLECEHSFCLTCISRSSVDRRTCPLCRAPIILDNIQIPAPLNLMEFKSYFDPLQNLSLFGRRSIFIQDDDVLSAQVYYMSNLQAVQLDNVEDYMCSTLSDRSKCWLRTAYKCWKCGKFTDYRGHSYGCLGCLRTERTIPRGQLVVKLESRDGVLRAEYNSMIDHLAAVHGENIEDFTEQANIASQYKFNENVVYEETLTEWAARVQFLM